MNWMNWNDNVWQTISDLDLSFILLEHKMYGSSEFKMVRYLNNIFAENWRYFHYLVKI